MKPEVNTLLPNWHNSFSPPFIAGRKSRKINLDFTMVVHKQEAGAKHYEVKAPSSRGIVFNIDSDDDEGSDDPDKADTCPAPGGGDTPATKKKPRPKSGNEISEKTICMQRRICGDCLDLDKDVIPIPEYITWVDRKQDAPDSCPICRKVLFRTEKPSPSREIDELFFGDV